MIRVRPFPATRRHMAGLSLIEMMIALVMALIVAAGIITVFTSTSSSNKVQAQMAALQEEGRFAIHSLRTDLANANGGYCSNTGGNAGEVSSGLFLDGLRSPTVYSPNALDLPDNTVALDAPTQAYSLPSSLFMRGYDCTTSVCTPAGLDTLVSSGLPAMGTAVGARVPGADVLTVRYLKPGSGWAIVPSTAASGSYITTTPPNFTITIRPVTGSGEDPASSFTGGLAMLADCSGAQIYDVTGSGTLTVSGADYAQPQDITGNTAPRVFDFTNDFQTVTYYLKVVCANGTTACPGGPTTGELVRRVNGTDQPLVRGVERLNFSYGLIGADGTTRFLTAEQVTTGTDASGDSIACYVPSGWSSDVALPGGMSDAGCLWRAIQTIQVSILMDGQTPMYTLSPAEMKYVYTPDSMAMQDPTAHAVQPNADQGFPNQLIRREFTTLVALRNFNP